MYKNLGQEEEICGQFVRELHCSNNHYYAKQIFCNREWCKTCGQDESASHKREMYRKLDLIYGLYNNIANCPSIGYFVFTLPQHIRYLFTNKANLKRLQKAVYKILQENGFNEGFSRWHWFGDGRMSEGELDLGEYHPHLNVIVTGAQIERTTLIAIRDAYKKAVETITKTNLHAIVIHYSYATTPQRVYRMVRYIMRPTFKRLTGQNRWLADMLYRFKNVNTFGKREILKQLKENGRQYFQDWINDDSESKSDEVDTNILKVRMIQQGFCFQCLEKLQYSNTLHIDELQERVIEALDGGFLILTPPKPINIEFDSLDGRRLSKQVENREYFEKLGYKFKDI